jgi:hypothetical protein
LPLVVIDFYNAMGGFSAGEVTDLNPRWGLPGELGLHLSPKGNLLRFRAVPLGETNLQFGTVEPDWRKWFPAQTIGFDVDTLQGVDDKRLPPPDASDQFKVWKGLWPNTTNEFYVEAAAYSGKPVYFEVFTAAQFASGFSPVSVQSLNLSWFANPAGTLYALLLASGAVLGWRNFRLGRSDRRGAFRLAFCIFCSALLITLFIAHHTTSSAELCVIEMGLAQACVMSLVSWMWYTALEPFVRRLWPQMLVSWTRLLDGRFRDPLVGRDLLVGVAIGWQWALPTRFR